MRSYLSTTFNTYIAHISIASLSLSLSLSHSYIYKYIQPHSMLEGPLLLLEDHTHVHIYTHMHVRIHKVVSSDHEPI